MKTNGLGADSVDLGSRRVRARPRPVEVEVEVAEVEVEVEVAEVEVGISPGGQRGGGSYIGVFSGTPKGGGSYIRPPTDLDLGHPPWREVEFPALGNPVLPPPP